MSRLSYKIKRATILSILILLGISRKEAITALDSSSMNDIIEPVDNNEDEQDIVNNIDNYNNEINAVVTELARKNPDIQKILDLNGNGQIKFKRNIINGKNLTSLFLGDKFIGLLPNQIKDSDVLVDTKIEKSSFELDMDHYLDYEEVEELNIKYIDDITVVISEENKIIDFSKFMNILDGKNVELELNNCTIINLPSNLCYMYAKNTYFSKDAFKDINHKYELYLDTCNLNDCEFEQTNNLQLLTLVENKLDYELLKKISNATCIDIILELNNETVDFTGMEDIPNTFDFKFNNCNVVKLPNNTRCLTANNTSFDKNLFRNTKKIIALELNLCNITDCNLGYLDDLVLLILKDVEYDDKLLSKLPNKTSIELEMSNRTIDFTQIANVSNKISFNLHFCKVINLPNNIRCLTADNTYFDVDSFKNAKQILTIDLDTCDISNCEYSQLQNLDTLTLDNTKINYELFNKTTELTKLQITQYNEFDFSKLTQLIKLGYLKLDRCGITNIKGINKLKCLVYFSANENNIIDASEIGDATNLETLLLENNKIKDISFLKNLNKLESLHLNGNCISNYEIFKELTLENLNWLTIGDNIGYDGNSIEVLKNYDSKIMDTTISNDIIRIQMEKIILDEITSESMSEWEIIEAIYNFTKRSMVYAHENENWKSIVDTGLSDIYRIDQAYFSLKTGIGCCDHYATIFHDLIKLKGLDIKYISTKIDSNIHHAYNMINIDGQYYYFDACWDRDNDKNMYFGLSLEDMKLKGKRSLYTNFNYGNPETNIVGNNIKIR